MTQASNQPMPPDKGWPAIGTLSLFGIKSLRAVAELAQARLDFARLTVKEIQALNSRHVADSQKAGAARKAQIAWIAYVVPRIARIMPWRSDCLVQALAAQNWLATLGIKSEIVIGVERPADAPFGAHAWLKCGETVVTGGETARYTEIL